MNEKVVSFFGGHRITEDQLEYQEAFLVSKYLARHGFAIRSGGYSGIMEAVTKGAVIEGAVCEGIGLEDWEKESPNSFLDLKNYRESKNLYERLSESIDGVNLFVIFHGGVGTLAELMVVWMAKIMKKIPDHVLIVTIGDGWGPFLDNLKKNFLISDEDFKLIKRFSSGKEFINSEFVNEFIFSLKGK